MSQVLSCSWVTGEQAFLGQFIVFNPHISGLSKWDIRPSVRHTHLHHSSLETHPAPWSGKHFQVLCLLFHELNEIKAHTNCKSHKGILFKSNAIVQIRRKNCQEWQWATWVNAFKGSNYYLGFLKWSSRKGGVWLLRAIALLVLCFDWQTWIRIVQLHKPMLIAHGPSCNAFDFNHRPVQLYISIRW